MPRCVLAFDHGTSGVKAALVSERGRVLGSAFEATPIIYLPGGGAEQDPEGWWRALLATSKRLLASGAVAPREIAAIGVSSTFSSTVAVDREGRALMSALTWLDSRGAPYVERLMRGFPSLQGYGLRKLIRWVRRTGGGPALSGKDDIAHALLVKHAFPEVYERTYKFLPSKDYLNMRLCGRFAATFDSITLFWVTDTRDIDDVRYDDELIRATGIARDKLPPLCGSTEILGRVSVAIAEELGIPRETVVVAGSPDHQSAAVGAGAVRDFEAHLYVGTSSWIQCVVPFKKTDVLHSIASLPTSIPGRYYCANEQDMAGGCLAFAARNLLGLEPGAEAYHELDALAGLASPGSGGVLFYPWLNGERTPVDDPALRGGWHNLSKTTSRSELARAVYEGVALNARWSLRYVERFVGRRLDPIRIAGGGGRSDLWCQIFADVLQRTIRQLEDPMQANARGAAFLALVGLGELSFEQLPELVPHRRDYAPRPENRRLYDERFEELLAAYRCQKGILRCLGLG